jgi:hypothetical protein
MLSVAASANEWAGEICERIHSLALVATRRAGRLLAALGVLLALAGCETTGGFRMSTSTPAQVSTVAAEGRSPRLVSGAGQAYWLWKDADHVWHLRTTAPRNGRRFRGLIRPLPGVSIVDVKPLHAAGPNEGFSAEGRLITINYWTRNGIDGFDFRIEGTGCVEFDLRIDGDGNPQNILIGKNDHRPRDAHFLLCP